MRWIPRMEPVEAEIVPPVGTREHEKFIKWVENHCEHTDQYVYRDGTLFVVDDMGTWAVAHPGSYLIREQKPGRFRVMQRAEFEDNHSQA